MDTERSRTKEPIGSISKWNQLWQMEALGSLVSGFHGSTTSWPVQVFLYFVHWNLKYNIECCVTEIENVRRCLCVHSLCWNDEKTRKELERDWWPNIFRFVFKRLQKSQILAAKNVKHKDLFSKVQIHKNLLSTYSTLIYEFTDLCKCYRCTRKLVWSIWAKKNVKISKRHYNCWSEIDKYTSQLR